MTDMRDQKMDYPPLELANRVGSLGGAVKPLEYYDALGRETRAGIVDRLPANWTFHRKRVLDFGCGAGRTLRHFVHETDEGEFWGCDIDEPSIAWMEEHLSPPFHVFRNGSEPPLDQPESSFDLIWAVSVFTHLASSWSRWLAELHRVLKPDGLLFATFMGQGMSQEIAAEPWDEDLFGMNVIKCGQSWDLGGPMVIHSPWWIREHWGRGFDILSIAPEGFASKPWLDHGWVMMRKRGGSVTAKEFERIDPDQPREVLALAHSVQELQAECSELRLAAAHYRGLEAEVERARDDLIAERRGASVARRDEENARQDSLHAAGRLMAVEEVLAQANAQIYALEETIAELQPAADRVERSDRVLADMQDSVSWRVTAPLRVLKRRVRTDS